jgi:hypothetical protein
VRAGSKSLPCQGEIALLRRLNKLVIRVHSSVRNG